VKRDVVFARPPVPATVSTLATLLEIGPRR
jgi:hypothetical protein